MYVNSVRIQLVYKQIKQDEKVTPNSNLLSNILRRRWLIITLSGKNFRQRQKFPRFPR